MRILEDGNVEIRNNKTGETKIVSPDALPNFGISTETYLKEIESQQKLKGYQETGQVQKDTSDPLAAQKSVALQATKKLEERFGRGDVGAVGTSRDIALSEGPSPAQRFLGFIKRATAGAFKPALKEDINIYKRELETFLPVFTQAFGSGAPQEGEAKRLIAAVPGPKSTNREAKTWFDDIKQLLGELPDTEDTKKKDSIASEQPQPQGNQKDLLDKVLGALPTIGGIMGGVTGAGVGAIGGFGIGALPAGAVGTGAGTLAGTGLAESIETLTGRQKETEAEVLKKEIIDPLTAGTLDIVTGGLFKGAGLVKGLLGKSVASVGDDLALKAIRPSPSQQRKFLEKTGQEMKDFVIEKGLFKKGTEQADDIIKPLQQGFDDIAVNSGLKVPVDNVVKLFDDKINTFKGVLDPSAQNIAKRLEDTKGLLLEKYGSVPGGIDIGDLTKDRRLIDDLIPESAFSKEEIAAGSRSAVRDILQDSIRQTSEGLTDSAGRSLKDIGTELSKMYTFRDIAEAQSFLGKGALPLGLLKQIGLTGAGGLIGGAGGFVTGQGDPMKVATGILIGLGIPMAVNNPKVVSALARNLPNIGKAIELAPKSQRVKLFGDLLRRTLTNIGSSAISDVGE